MLRNLKLSRPLAVFDLETTSADPSTARIVEFSFLVIRPDGINAAYTERVNPGIPIPPEASAVHGIYDEDVRDRPPFASFASRIGEALEGCDLAGFNVLSYDLRVLLSEMTRARIRFPLAGRKVVDAMRIFHARERRDLTAAVQFYCGRPHDGAHGAWADVEATTAVLDAQVARYEDLPTHFDELHAAVVDPAAVDLCGTFIRDGDGNVVFGIGKYKGYTLTSIARAKPDYLRWMLGQDFLEDAKELCRGALGAMADE